MSTGMRYEHGICMGIEWVCEYAVGKAIGQGEHDHGDMHVHLDGHR